MKYGVVERTIYERYLIIEADDPEEAEEICKNKSYDTDMSAEYAGTEYRVVGTEED